MMTGWERLRAVASGQPCDRVPVFCNLLDQGALELGLSIRDYYSKGEYVAEAQLRMRAKYGYDNLWSLFYVGREAELLGCREIIFAEDGPPNVGHLVIRNHDDISRLEVPADLAAHPAFQEPLRCLDILKREAGSKYPICAYVTASMTLPALLMGMDKWLELLLLGPPSLRDELLEKCSDFFRKEIAAYRNAGAEVILYADPFASTDFVPMKLIRELSLPWMERDLLPGGVSDVVYYCGGARMNSVIARVWEQLGIPTYYLSPFDDIAEAKKILCGRGVVGGVINDIRLIDWSGDEIRTEVGRIMAAGLPGGNFLFGTLVMPFHIPEANIRTMLEAAFEFGKCG